MDARAKALPRERDPMSQHLPEQQTAEHATNVDCLLGRPSTLVPEEEHMTPSGAGTVELKPAPSDGSRVPPTAKLGTAGSHPNGQVLLEVTDYEGNEVRKHPTMTRAEVLERFDLHSYDCCRAKCLGVHGFRDPGAGEWVTYGTACRELSQIGEDILDVLQLNPGIRFDKAMLYIETGHESLAGEHAPTHIYRMRLAHRERKATEHFVRTEKDGVFWPARLTWIKIRPVLRRERAVSSRAD